jgi:hypothetical protein
LDHLHGLGFPAQGSFRRDDLGWFQAELALEEVRLEVERYLVSEPDIRGELNSWAAWLETLEHHAHHGPLMERMIGTKQLFTLRSPAEADGNMAEKICLALSQFLSHTTEGVYQVDGQGFFDQAGQLLVPEE